MSLTGVVANTFSSRSEDSTGGLSSSLPPATAPSQWSSNFVGFESDQIQTPAEYGLQHNSTSPHPHPDTHCLHILYFDTGGGGGGGYELK